MEDNITKRMEEIISPKSGYFGRIFTWGQKIHAYEYLGFIFSENIDLFITSVPETNRKTLIMVMTYFEIHMAPLKDLLKANEQDGLSKFYAEIAWSHFATIVMFGMLETVTKGGKGETLNAKGENIKDFLKNNLSTEKKRTS